MVIGPMANGHKHASPRKYNNENKSEKESKYENLQKCEGNDVKHKKIVYILYVFKNNPVDH